MINHFLVEHAMTKVWGQSIQDRQHVIEMARFTPKGGAFARAKIHRYFVDLPIKDWLHVYQIGSVYPILLSIPSIKNDWVRADLLAMEHGIVMNVFLASGANIPLLHCWVRQVSDNNILLAVEVDYTLDLGIDNYIIDVTKQVLAKRKICDEKVYFRCYQNAKAQTLKWAETTESDFKPVSYEFTKVNHSRDFILFINKVKNAKNKHSNKGQGVYFIDGFLVNPVLAYTSDLDGKILTYIHDETILFSNTVPLTSLGTFNSLQDNGARKMVLVMEEIIKDSSIHFHDDIDFYITTNPKDKDFKGAYLGRVRKDIVRQVAQFAYSIRTESINAIIAEHINYFMQDKEIFIHYVVRDGGMRKGLEFHSERLNELALLPFEKVKEALYGVNSVLPEWQAKNLEVSDYMRLISAFYSEINTKLISKAYGLHALQKLFFTEMQRNNPDKTIKLKLGHKSTKSSTVFNSVIYMYDKDSRTIGGNFSGNAINGDEVYISEDNAEFIECIPGSPNWFAISNIINEDYASDDLIKFRWRAYIHANIDSGDYDNWVDVTGDNRYYEFITDNGRPRIVWNKSIISNNRLATAIRIDNTVTTEGFPFEVNSGYSGTLSATIGMKVQTNGSLRTMPLSLPVDKIDIFLNGKPLIEGIDYYIKFPRFVITKFLNTDVNDTKIDVRYYGLSYSDRYKYRKPREIGFTKKGILSANGKYDLRNDRNIRVIVDGEFKTRDEVKFAENDTGRAMPDGRPYCIEDIRFSLPIELDVDLVELTKKAEEMDEKVSAYITAHVDTSVTGQGFIDGEKYQLTSPLISSLIYAIGRFGILSNLANKTITDKVIEEEIKDYLHLLEFEPIHNGIDTHYVNIRPYQSNNPVTVTAEQYLFLELVIHHYLKDSVDLTPYVKIG